MVVVWQGIILCLCLIPSYSFTAFVPCSPCIGLHRTPFAPRRGPRTTLQPHPAYSDPQVPPLGALEQPQSSLATLGAALVTPRAKTLFVWLGFFGILAQLRSFYGVILGTFILSYAGNSAVNFGTTQGNRFLEQSGLPVKRLPRRFYSLAYIAVLVTGLTMTTVLTVPRLNVESQFLVSLSTRDNPYSVLSDWIRNIMGVDALDRLEPFLLSVAGEDGRIFAGYEENYRTLIASKLRSTAPWPVERSAKFAKLLQFTLSGYVQRGLSLCSSVVTQLTGLFYKAILSLLFSFMVVFDFPRLQSGVASLKNSRLKFPYEVLAPQVRQFAKLVGQSFEVQFMIAFCNTILTTAGLFFLGISGAWILGFITFICSFIPVAGVFLSTLPMAVSALSEYSVSKVGEIILMVLIVHAVEAYLLNPQIYSAKLKLHPVVVLAVLYITEHWVGVQGLILAVPVTVYALSLLRLV